MNIRWSSCLGNRLSHREAARSIARRRLQFESLETRRPLAVLAGLVEDATPLLGINNVAGDTSSIFVRPFNGLTTDQSASFANVSGTLYFTANDGANGFELWRIGSSGTAEMVEDSLPGGGIRPGNASSQPGYLTNIGGTLYFRANDGTNGHEIWRVNSSGSAEMVEDAVPDGGIRPGGDSSIPFIAFTGTQFNPPSQRNNPVLTNVHGTPYFMANDGINGVELWRVNSQGTAEMVDDAASGVGIRSGTSNPFVSIFLGTTVDSAIPPRMLNVGGTLYFAADDGTNGDELWRVNASGLAEMVEDSVPGNGLSTGFGGSLPQNFTNANGTLYFAASIPGAGVELWRVNASGTAEMIEDAIAGGGINPSGANSLGPIFTSKIENFDLAAIGSTVYFRAFDGVNGVELWRVSESGPATMVEDSIPGGGIRPGASSAQPYGVRNVNGTIYFVANDGTNGLELWRIGNSGIAEVVNGVQGGIGISSLTNTAFSPFFAGPGSPAPVLVTSGNTLYFQANDGTNGSELWRVNQSGLAEMVDATTPGGGLTPGPASSTLSNFIDINGRLYFTFNDGSSGLELWRINGQGRAELVDDLVDDGGIQTGVASSSPKYLTNVAGTLYFAATGTDIGTELWRLVPNQPPTDLVPSTLSIPENIPAGTMVATINTIDPNLRETFAYSFVSGSGDTDNSSFTIVGNELRIVPAPDFEAKSSYSIRVRSIDSDGADVEKSFTLSVVNSISSVIDRRIFYNRSTSSVFGNGSDNPIGTMDPDKSALLPGQTATFANYTNYVRGLNGIVIDVAGLGLGVGVGDFQFTVWDGISPGGFTTMQSAPTVGILSQAGSGGSTRIKIEFDDGAVKNTWLRVTVLANARTELATDDVFYFGSSIGDMNVNNVGSPIVVRVNASDTAAVRQNQSPNQNSVDVSNFYDLNKDGRVNASDTAGVRQNQQPAGSIQLFTAPVGLTMFEGLFTQTDDLNRFADSLIDETEASGAPRQRNPRLQPSVIHLRRSRSTDAYFADFGKQPSSSNRL